MTTITPELLNSIRADLNKAFAEIESRHGVKLSIGSMSYNASELTSKLKGVVPGATTREDLLFEQQVKCVGLSTKLVNGKQLTGYNSRAKVYQWIYKEGTESYKCDHKTAVRYFGIK